MRSTVLITVLFTTLAASGQTPVVTSIDPDSGPDIGGTRVAINGRNLSTIVDCLLPCPSLVAFGEIDVEALEESDTLLIVTSPPHAAGPVDVTVKILGETPVTVPNGFTFTRSAESSYEKVLLPIYLDGVVPGANGSLWRTNLWLRNDGDTFATLAPWPCPVDMPCPAIFPVTYSLEPGLSLNNLPPFFQAPDPNPSRLLYVAKPAASDVSFGLRVADSSRATTNAGTDLPVIRESETLLRRAQLFNIPLDPGFRVLLRIYDVTFSESRFRINIYPQTDADDPLLSSTFVNATTNQTGEFRTDAAYAQFDVSGLLRLDGPWPGSVRIEIVPQTPASRYWAFASITNNETQLVTLVTPQ